MTTHRSWVVCEQVAEYWTNFAATGSPNGNGGSTLPKWPAYVSCCLMWWLCCAPSVTIECLCMMQVRSRHGHDPEPQLHHLDDHGLEEGRVRRVGYHAWELSGSQPPCRDTTQTACAILLFAATTLHQSTPNERWWLTHFTNTARAIATGCGARQHTHLPVRDH